MTATSDPSGEGGPPVPPPDPSPPPRIGVAAGDERLRRRLRSALQDRAVRLEEVPRGEALWDRFADQDVDLVIVRRSQVPASGPAGPEGPPNAGSGPDVVVLSDDADAAERARLRAGGAAHLLDLDRETDALGADLETLASAALGGGSAGADPGLRQADGHLSDFLSRSPYMREFLDVVRRVADSDATLLILGETGVGKERLARAIHAESPRADGPFITVPCGALPDHLLESELFGYEKGAFTGASARRRGYFEQAHGGTLLLDEVGELPAGMQVKLLTVLQRREVVRLGGERPSPVDVRVMAATNRDLAADVQAGRFREDLFYRLNVVPLTVPPLRERREDLPDLVGSLIGHFREVLPETRVTGITNGALQALQRHSWPGNVRELINVIERAVLLCRGTEIAATDLWPGLPQAPDDQTAAAGDGQSDSGLADLPGNWREWSLKEVRQWGIARAEQAYLRALLRQHQGKLAAVARDAGVSPRALYDRLRRYDLRKEDFRPAAPGADHPGAAP